MDGEGSSRQGLLQLRGMRLPRVLFIGLLLVAAGAAGAFFWSQQARVQLWEERARAMREQLVQVQQQTDSLKGQLVQAEAARRTLTEQLDAAQRRAAEAQETITTLQQQQAESAVRAATLQGEKEALAFQLTGALKERDEMRRRVATLQTEKEELEQRRRALEQRYASLARGNTPMPRQPQAARAPGSRETPGAIELPPIVVHHPPTRPAAERRLSDRAVDEWGDHPAPSPMSPLEPSAGSAPARIVEVNERYAFVVLDRGSADGIAPGMVFDVIREGYPIGSATVRQVREHLSACDVGPSGETAMRFRVGDAAVLRRD